MLAGTYVVSGQGEKPSEARFKSVEIYVCVFKTDNSLDQSESKLTACDPSVAGPKAASLTNAVSADQHVLVDANGTFAATLTKPLSPKQCVYVTEVGIAPGLAIRGLSAKPTCVTPAFSQTAPLGMAVAGLDVSGASSTNPDAVFLGTGLMDIPLSSNPSRGNFFDSFFWVTGQLKIAGIAQPKTLTGALGSTSAAATYLATAVNANPDDIVQSIEGTGSVSFKIKHWPIPADSFDVGSYVGHLPQPSTIVSLSGIISIGAITPLSLSQASPPVYNLTTQIIRQYPNINFASSCTSAATPPSGCYVSFVPTDRSHFYRNYDVGVRLKIYAGDYTDDKYRFPGLADLTIGQNEYVTGGQLRRFVLHIGGVMPIPHADGIYTFGSMDLEMNKNSKDGVQLVLTPATDTSSTPLTYASTSVTDIPVSQPNRDRYQFGFGIDLFHLINSLAKKSSAAPAQVSIP